MSDPSDPAGQPGSAGPPAPPAPLPPESTPVDPELLEALGLLPPGPKPRPAREPFPWLNVALFAGTLLTTFWFGAYGFDVPFFTDDKTHAWHLGPGLATFLAAPWTLLRGWIFSVPLMSILLCHEMGHYVTARLHGVRQSLPYFIPFPFVGFGTMGAVIRMDARVPDRNVLLDIGVMGPIMGMVVAVPVMILGLHLSPVQPIAYPALLEGDSILYWALKFLIKGRIPEGWDVQLHPVALAGWIGFYLTMLNLFPIGQLDGGHVAYSTMRRPEPIYRVFNVLLIANGLALSLLGRNAMGIGFVIMGVLVFFLAGRHPPVLVPARPLTLRRKILGVVAAVLFVLTYVPVPWTLMD